MEKIQMDVLQKAFTEASASEVKNFLSKFLDESSLEEYIQKHLTKEATGFTVSSNTFEKAWAKFKEKEERNELPEDCKAAMNSFLQDSIEYAELINETGINQVVEALMAVEETVEEPTPASVAAEVAAEAPTETAGEEEKYYSLQSILLANKPKDQEEAIGTDDIGLLILMAPYCTISKTHLDLVINKVNTTLDLAILS